MIAGARPAVRRALLLHGVRTDRLRLKAELEALEAKMDGYLKELGY